jgi:hypothetical protein
MELCFYLLAEWPLSHDVYICCFILKIWFCLSCFANIWFCRWKRVVIPVLLIFPRAI